MCCMCEDMRVSDVLCICVCGVTAPGWVHPHSPLTQSTKKGKSLLHENASTGINFIYETVSVTVP